MSDNQKIVISLGGSLIIPDELDLNFLRSIKVLVEAEVRNGKSFIIITGGGKVCRKYQAAAQELGVSSSEELDWLGIHVTRMNAHFFRILMADLAHGEIITDPKVLGEITKPVVIAAGWKPGWSTDLVAVEIARTTGAKKLVNLSNIDYVYDKDPRKFPDAQKIEQASWAEFRKIIPAEWSPGVNTPFDPVAAKLAEELGLEVVIMNGKPLDNLQNYLEGQAFKGTVIK
ncbi:MAG: UMP kinase [bacterium]|nr:UMP kinase [bacterium]